MSAPPDRPGPCVLILCKFDELFNCDTVQHRHCTAKRFDLRSLTMRILVRRLTLNSRTDGLQYYGPLGVRRTLSCGATPGLMVKVVGHRPREPGR